VILPGSKATRADLAFLRAQGWDIDLAAHVRRGGRVLGLCGGYQMLGARSPTRRGSRGRRAEARLGLLDVETVMTPDKRLTETTVRATHASTGAFDGYEIHIGRTDGPDRARPFAHVEGRPRAPSAAMAG
jgi:adenosylcobyric acid synthase